MPTLTYFHRDIIKGEKSPRKNKIDMLPCLRAGFDKGDQVHSAGRAEIPGHLSVPISQSLSGTPRQHVDSSTHKTLSSITKISFQTWEFSL